MLQSLLLFLFSVLVGTFSGLFGIGGGILLVPGLIFLFGLTQTQAQGSSLAVFIAPVGLFAALEYYRQGNVNLPFVVVMAAGICLGAWLGARTVPHVPVAALRSGFGLLLLYVGWLFLLGPTGSAKANAVSAGGLAAGSGLLAGWLRRRRQMPPPDATPPADA